MKRWSQRKAALCAQFWNNELLGFATNDTLLTITDPAVNYRPGILNAHSVAAWVRGFPYIFTTRNGGNLLGVSYRRDFAQFTSTVGGGQRLRYNATSPAPFPQNCWVHVCWVWTPGILPAGWTLYYNAQPHPLTLALNEGPVQAPGVGPEQIGAHPASLADQQSSPGGIRNVVYFPYSLTASDVLKLYESKDPRTPVYSGAAPKGFWPLNNTFANLGVGTVGVPPRVTSAINYHGFTHWGTLNNDPRIPEIVP